MKYLACLMLGISLLACQSGNSAQKAGFEIANAARKEDGMDPQPAILVSNVTPSIKSLLTAFAQGTGVSWGIENASGLVWREYSAEEEPDVLNPFERYSRSTQVQIDGQTAGLTLNGDRSQIHVITIAVIGAVDTYEDLIERIFAAKPYSIADKCKFSLGAHGSDDLDTAFYTLTLSDASLFVEATTETSDTGPGITSLALRKRNPEDRIREMACQQK